MAQIRPKFVSKYKLMNAGFTCFVRLRIKLALAFELEKLLNQSICKAKFTDGSSKLLLLSSSNIHRAVMIENFQSIIRFRILFAALKINQTGEKKHLKKPKICQQKKL